MAGSLAEIEKNYELGLELVDGAQYFAAHEALEAAWRSAEPGERDFFQGLVHVAVAWYQAGRGNAVGCTRQLAKARRRLLTYSPSHRGLNVADLLDQVAKAEEEYPRLRPVRIHRL